MFTMLVIVALVSTAMTAPMTIWLGKREDRSRARAATSLSVPGTEIRR